MRLLVVIDRFSDIGSVVDYVARRFDSDAIEVGILALTGSGSGPANRHDVEPVQLLKDVADLAGRALNVDSVTTYLESGRSVAAITRVSKATGAGLVLLEASHTSRLRGAVTLNVLARRLFRECRCAVELIRTTASGQGGSLTVTVPIQADRVREFPVESLRRLTWRPGTCIRLVGLLPPLIERSRLEANDGSILLAGSRLTIRQAQTESELRRLGARLVQESGEQYPVEYCTTSASVSEVARQAACAGQILLVADEARPDSRMARSGARWLPAWQTLIAGCSVVLVSPGCPGRRSTSAWQPGTSSIEQAAK